LGLENTAVVVNDKGFVNVDLQRCTDDPAIYCIGDLAGDPMLAHKASHEGLVAAETLHGEKVAFEPRAIPAVVFTDPEIAWAGITETEAKEQKLDVKIAKFPWAASGRATAVERNDGLTKIIVDAKTDLILGIGLVGCGVGEMIGEAVLAIEMATLASDLKLSIHPHPTLSETIMEAAELIYGSSTHIYKPKKK
ncbi:MAG: dihydrolipoyl dehydrogenase, partial [Lentisphaeria bacterium]|nr:dihydrolipoyl dehydrogenase [Lentisphaeria bacterium]